MALRLSSVVFDANDHVALAHFWAAVLDWKYIAEDGYSSAAGGDGVLRSLDFVPTGNEKRSKNWMHLDLSSASLEHQRTTVERSVDLGARPLDVGQGPNAKHVVLADPEGNEFCVLEPGNKFVDYDGPIGSLTCDGTPAVGYFWGEVLGWPLVWDQNEETAIRARSGGLFITFGPPVAQKLEKRRLHIDVAPPADGDQQAEVARLLALGARHADIGQGDVPWVVMTDPDGNEFCVLTPR